MHLKSRNISLSSSFHRYWHMSGPNLISKGHYFSDLSWPSSKINHRVAISTEAQNQEQQKPEFENQFQPITAKLRTKTRKLREENNVSANICQTASPTANLIGFASPLLNTAVILRPNSICFRSTVCQKNNQSQRTITFLPVSAKPLMLA